jgi:hypothetical protein
MKLMIAALVFFGAAAVVGAQENTPGQQTPVAELSIGYSYIRTATSTGLSGNGGSGSVAVNVTSWLGAVGDFGIYHIPNSNRTVDGGTYTFGPRFSYRRLGRIVPFAETLFGGARGGPNPFTFAAGGGADVVLDRGGNFALRPEVDYFGFRENGGTLNAVRVSAGFVWRIQRR